MLHFESSEQFAALLIELEQLAVTVHPEGLAALRKEGKSDEWKLRCYAAIFRRACLADAQHALVTGQRRPVALLRLAPFIPEVSVFAGGDGPETISDVDGWRRFVRWCEHIAEVEGATPEPERRLASDGPAAGGGRVSPRLRPTGRRGDGRGAIEAGGGLYSGNG